MVMYLLLHVTQWKPGLGREVLIQYQLRTFSYYFKVILVMCGQWWSSRNIITHMHTLNCFFTNDLFVLFLPLSKKWLSWKWPFKYCTYGPIFSFLITYFALIVTLETIKKAASFIINNLIRVLGPRSQCKCYSAVRPFPNTFERTLFPFCFKVTLVTWKLNSYLLPYIMHTHYRYTQGAGKKFRFRSIYLLPRQEQSLPLSLHF